MALHVDWVSSWEGGGQEGAASTEGLIRDLRWPRLAAGAAAAAAKSHENIKAATIIIIQRRGRTASDFGVVGIVEVAATWHASRPIGIAGY